MDTKPNLTMEPIIELIWSPEEDELELAPHSGGGLLADACNNGCVATTIAQCRP